MANSSSFPNSPSKSEQIPLFSMISQSTTTEENAKDYARKRKTQKIFLLGFITLLLLVLATIAILYILNCIVLARPRPCPQNNSIPNSNFTFLPNQTLSTSITEPILVHMNETTLKCTDFYEHICADEIAHLKSSSMSNILDLTRSQKAQRLHNFLSNANTLTSSNSKAVRFLASLYQSCTANQQNDTTWRAEQIRNQLANDQYLFKISNSTNDPISFWIDLYSQFYRVTGTGLILNIYLFNDLTRLDERRVAIQMAFSDNSDFDELKPLLTEFFKLSNETINELLALNDQFSTLENAYSLEYVKIHQDQLTLGQLKNQTQINETQTVDWTRLMNGIMAQFGAKDNFTDSDLVYADLPSIAHALGVISQTPTQILHNYAILQYLTFLRNLLVDDCLFKSQQELFVFILSRINMDSFTATQSLDQVKFLHQKVAYIAQDMQRALQSILQRNSPIIDTETQTLLLTQLKEAHILTNYEPWFMDNTQLDRWYQMDSFSPDPTPVTYLNSLLTWIRHYIPLKLSRRTGFPFELMWDNDMLDPIPWATSQFVFLPLEFLQQRPFNLQQNSPNLQIAQDYGTMGTIIAHELIHLLYFAHLRKHSVFQENGQCFKDLYGGIVEPLTGLRLNGNLTFPEDIADNAAIQVAWNAYQTAGKDQTTAEEDEQFFASYTKMYCDASNRTQLEKSILKDDHTLLKYRAQVVLSHFQPFAETFNCSPGTPMNEYSEKGCLVW